MVKQLKNNLRLMIRSFKYDCLLLFGCYSNHLPARVELIIKKYFLLTKHLFLGVPTQPGKSRIKLNGRWLYYESTFGILGWQTTLVNFQKDFLRYLNQLNRPIIVDIGAHIGYFSLALANVFPQSQIYACEPVSLAFKLLQKNCRGVKEIISIRIGFSDSVGTGKINYVENLLMYSSLSEERFDWAPNHLTEKVTLKTLDLFCQKNQLPQVDLLKIDAEGWEEKILKGAPKTLTRTHFLLIECSLDQVNGSTFSSLTSYLFKPGANFQLINVGGYLYGPANQLLTIDLLLENLNFKP